MPQDNLTSLYNYIKSVNSNFTVDENTFRNDMSDNTKRQKTYDYVKGVNSNFKVDYNTFSNDMGFGGQVVQQPVAQTAQEQPTFLGVPKADLQQYYNQQVQKQQAQQPLQVQPQIGVNPTAQQPVKAISTKLYPTLQTPPEEPSPYKTIEQEQFESQQFQQKILNPNQFIIDESGQLEQPKKYVVAKPKKVLGLPTEEQANKFVEQRNLPKIKEVAKDYQDTDPQKSSFMWEQAINIEPNNYENYLNYSYNQAQLGNAQQALDNANTAEAILKSTPLTQQQKYERTIGVESPSVYQIQSWAKNKLGDYEGSIDAGKKSLQILSQKPTGKYAHQQNEKDYENASYTYGVMANSAAKIADENGANKYNEQSKKMLNVANGIRVAKENEAYRQWFASGQFEKDFLYSFVQPEIDAIMGVGSGVKSMVETAGKVMQSKGDLKGNVLKTVNTAISTVFSSFMAANPVANYGFAAIGTMGEGYAPEIYQSLMAPVSAFIKDKSDLSETQKELVNTADVIGMLLVFKMGHNVIKGVGEGNSIKAEKQAIQDAELIKKVVGMQELTEAELKKVEQIIEDAPDTEVNKAAQMALKGAEKKKEIQTETDTKIAVAQKKGFYEKDVKTQISDEVFTTIDKLEKGEPITNEFIDKASTELYNEYKRLEKIKDADTRTNTIEQINEVQERIGRDIELLENTKLKQKETGKFAAEKEIETKTETPLVEPKVEPIEEVKPVTETPVEAEVKPVEKAVEPVSEPINEPVNEVKPFDQRTDTEHATYIKDQFRKQFSEKGVPQEQIDGAIALMEARAKASGKGDGWYRGIEDVKSGDVARGAVETLENGKKVIHALERPDFSTMVHKIAHIFEGDLTKAESKTVTDWAGTKEWNTKTSEKWSRGFERYLRNGKAPTAELKTLFEKFKTWLTDIYKTLKGSEIENKVSPEVKKIFDRLLTEQEKAKPTEPTSKSVLKQYTDNQEQLYKDHVEKTLQDKGIEIGNDKELVTQEVLNEMSKNPDKPISENVEKGVDNYVEQFGEKPTIDALKDVESTAKALENVDKDKLPLVRDVASEIIKDYKKAVDEIKRLNDEKENLTNEQKEAIIKKSRYKKSEKHPDKYEYNTGASITRKTEQQIIDDYYENKIKKIKRDEPREGVLNIYRKQDKEISTPNAISEAYHKAKKDGSNPELVKAVEDLLGKKEPPPATDIPATTKVEPVEEMVLYRGTSKNSKNSGKYLSDSYDYAKSFANRKSGKEGMGDVQEIKLKKGTKIFKSGDDTGLSGMVDKIKSEIPDLTSVEIDKIKNWEYNEVLENRGYDGISYTEGDSQSNKVSTTVELFNPDKSIESKTVKSTAIFSEPVEPKVEGASEGVKPTELKGFDKTKDAISNILDAYSGKKNIIPEEFDFKKEVKRMVDGIIEELGLRGQELIDKVREYIKDVPKDIKDEVEKILPDVLPKEEKAGEFEKLVATLPKTDNVKQYLSGESIEKYEGEKARNEQDYLEANLKQSLEHGVKIIESAKQSFGDNYVEKVLDYLENEKIDPDSKSLTYISLENDLAAQKIKFPEREYEISKLQDLVREKSQLFANKAGRAIALQRLRKFAEAGYDIEKVTNELFSTKQIETKRKVEKALNIKADDINKEAEIIEKESIVGEESVVNELVRKGIESEINKIYEKLPSARKVKADKYIAALNKVQSSLRGRAYDATIGVPIAIIDAGITTIKHAIRVGVNIADAIELGIEKIKKEYGKKWDKEDVFRNDMLDELKKQGIDVKKKTLSVAEKVEIAKNNVRKQNEKIKQEILDKKRELESRGLPLKGDVEYQRLIQEQAALKKLRDKYIPEENFYENEKQQKKVANKLVKEIGDINSQIKDGERTIREKGGDKITSERIEKLKAEKKARLDLLEAIDPVKKEVVKNALIDAGFGREMTVKTKNGREKRMIIDWKKLAGEEKSIKKIQDHVEKYLKDKGYSDGEIARMSDALIKEYNDILSNVIQKSVNELNKGNKAILTADQKSASQKLAEQFNYGLFDKQPDTYDYLMNKVLGISDLSQGTFFEAKKIGQALSELYKAKFNDTQIDPFNLTHIVNVIDNKLRILINKEIRQSKGTGFLNAARVVQSYMEASQRMMLNTIKQRIENPLSGAMQTAITELSRMGSGKDSPQLRKQRMKMARQIFKDIQLNGGVYFGKVTSQFLNKGGLDDAINKMSDSHIYHGIMSELIGRGHLEAADAMFKSMLTDKYFAESLINVLTSESNPKGKMSRDAANKYVTEALTGQNFENAKAAARQIIDHVNKTAGGKLVPDNQQSIDRLANDIVRQALLQGDKVTIEQLKAAYNASYRGAGFDLGHEPNNPISIGVRFISASMEKKINDAVKEKEWNKAAVLTITSIFNRNILNPFVGGGTNWIVLKAQKMGLDMFSGIYDNIMRGKIDLSSEAGVKKLERTLLNNLKARNTNSRLLIGGLASVLTYMAFRATGADDKYEEWIKKNKWAQKYAQLLIPEYMVAQAYLHNKEFGKYMANFFNSNINYNDMANIQKGVTAANEKGDYAEIGAAFGGMFNVPIPWRPVKEIESIYRGMSGKPQRALTPNPKTFVDGWFKTGMVNYILSKEGEYADLKQSEEDKKWLENQLESKEEKAKESVENKRQSLVNTYKLKEGDVENMTDDQVVWNYNESKHKAEVARYERLKAGGADLSGVKYPVNKNTVSKQGIGRMSKVSGGFNKIGNTKHKNITKKLR